MATAISSYPSLETVPQTLIVPWNSGNEVLNLDDIKTKLKSLTHGATVQTTEHRTDGSHDVVYQPLLTRSPDGFTLTYKDKGSWLNEQEKLEEADGLTGNAEYCERVVKGEAKWSCIWCGDERSDEAIPFDCTLSKTTRENTSVKRAVRDAKFRKLIFGPKPKCLITGETVESVLEAAHIHEVKHEGTDTIDNGFVMRSDIHKLFDSHVLTVSSEGKFSMNPVPKSYEYLLKNGQWIEEPKILNLRRYVKNIDLRNEQLLNSTS
jgi:hypothetical protein